MSKGKTPFRRSQVVSPMNAPRRFAKSKTEMKKAFDIYVTDIETGEETLAVTVHAFTSREAIGIAKKKLSGSPLLRKITHAAYTAVEVEE